MNGRSQTPDAEAADGRIAKLERRAECERRARIAAESLLEIKSRELNLVNQQLARLAADLEGRVEARTRELSAARERALELAEHDQLTGLANRACFSRVLDACIVRGRADGGRFALFLIDLDRFKDINDSLGHEAGDTFLRHAARRLLRALPLDATLMARLGGDEFAAIVPIQGEGCTLRALAGTMIASISQPVGYRDRMLEASCSIGAATYPDDATTASDLQRFADIALYRSKVTRAAFTLFDAAMGRELDARQAVGAALSQAIRTGEIEAWVQPIVDGGSGRPVGVEALARWRHPTLGLLAPNTFLGLAEERGLMHDLFARMMRSACPPARAWIRDGAIRYLSVNLSPSQFKLGSVADDVIALLAELDFPASCLTVEITEEVLMHDLDRARVQLERLAAHGVRVALDDFGVGYANIGYLRQLPIHRLKLDRLLTADVVHEKKARSILGAIVEIGRALELDLVVEGVEDTSQALWLAHLGCRSLQGYLYGQPMPAEAFDRRLAEDPRRIPGAQAGLTRGEVA